MTPNPSPPPSDQAFTLVEAALCLALLGLLVVALIPLFKGQVIRTKAQTVEQLLEQARDEIINLGLMNGSCILPAPGPDATVPEGMVNRLDPWGNPLYYIVDPRVNRFPCVCSMNSTDLNATHNGHLMTDIAFIVGSRGKNRERDVLNATGEYRILNREEKVDGTSRVFDDTVQVVSLAYVAAQQKGRHVALDCRGTALCLPFLKTPHDASPYWHNGTVQGAVTTKDRFGYDEGAYFFNGTFNGVNGDKQYIDYGDDRDLNVGTGDFSLAAWVRVMDTPPDRFGAIVGRGFLSGHVGYGLFISSVPTARDHYCFTFHMRKGANLKSVDSGDQATQYPIPDRWHFVVGVADRNQPDGLRIYVDGQRMNSTVPLDATHDLVDWQAHFAVGVRYAQSNAAWRWRYFLRGKIDDVRLYKRALSAQEILTMYDNERP